MRRQFIARTARALPAFFRSGSTTCSWRTRPSRQGERLQVVPGDLRDIEPIVVVVCDVPTADRVEGDLRARGAAREPLDEAVGGEIGPHGGAGTMVERCPAMEIVLCAGPL